MPKHRWLYVRFVVYYSPYRTTFHKTTMSTKFLRVGAIALAVLLANAASAETLEVALEGLNCALCGEAMKDRLKQVSGAHDVEPKLECGRLYLDVPPGAKVSEGGLGMVLLSNGFTLKSVKPTNMSLAEVRATSTC